MWGMAVGIIQALWLMIIATAIATYWFFKILFWLLYFLFSLLLMPFGYRPKGITFKRETREKEDGKFYETLESQIFEEGTQKKVEETPKHAPKGIVIFVSLILLILLVLLTYSGFKGGKISFGMSMLGITFLIGIVTVFKIKEILRK